ncbi:MAG: hypothetical protein ACKVUS_02515 [Saprospiraceae bacterium]
MSRTNFWEHFYLERSGEMAEFSEFVESEMEMLIISGHVGTGKSTFIRHKYEYNQQCSGLILDMNSHRNTLNDPDSLLQDVMKMIQDSYLAQIRVNIKYLLLCKTEYRDYTYRTPPAIPEGSFTAGDLEHKSWGYLAMQVLEHLQGVQEIYEYTRAHFGHISSEHTEGFRATLRTAFVEEGVDPLPVLNLLKWYHYIILYKILGKHSLPTVLTFDNLDWTDLNVVKGKFFLCVQSILNEYNNETKPFFAGRKAKAIIAVRDENLAQFQHAAAVSSILAHLRFGEFDYVFRGASNAKVLPAQTNFVDQVIKRRLHYLEETLREEFPNEVKHFIQIVQDFWMEDAEFKQSIARFRFQDFCNGSLRLTLDFVHESTCDTIHRMRQKGWDISTGNHIITLPVLRGRIIYSLWENGNTSSILEEFADSLQNELRDEYCCIFRLILVYLSRQKNEQIDFEYLMRDFCKLFPLRHENEFRQNIYRLYAYWERQGELITIYQKSELRESEHIEPTARIRLNGRGKVFFSTVLVNLDFFGGIIAREDKRFRHLILHEMPPKLALDYTKKILQLTRDLAERHRKFYLATIFPTLVRTEGRLPFDLYAGKFTFDDKLHLERVCENHLSVLRSYLEECLKGPEDTGLLLSVEEKEQLRAAVPTNLIKEYAPQRPKIEELGPIIERLPSDNVLHKLWQQVFKDYGLLVEEIKSLRSLSWDMKNESDMAR